MELEGSLRAFKFPEILQFLGRGQMTGILSLRRDDEEVRVSFREGQITGASSTARTVRLGDMLMYAGSITRQALDEALESQETSGGTPRFLGDILLQRGLAPEDELRGFIELQIKEEIWDLFNWEDGSFRFEQSDVRKGGTIDIKLDVEPLLLEGSRRLDEWQIIKSNIGGGREVFRVNPDLAGPPDVNLDLNTWQVLSLINGRLSVDSITRLSNFGKFETYYALDHLLRAGIIVSVDDAYDAKRDTGIFRRRKNPSERNGDSHTAAHSRTSSPEAKPSSLLSLFGKRRGSPGDEAEQNFDPDALLRSPSGASRSFESDVGLACAIINTFVDTLTHSSKFAAEGDPSDWIYQMWRGIEQRYPRADLLRMEGHHLSSSRYDRYAHLEGGLTDAIRGCHEDTIEALRALWFALIDHAHERMDPAAADKLADQCLQNFMQVRPVITAPEFSLTRWKRQHR